MATGSRNRTPRQGQRHTGNPTIYIVSPQTNHGRVHWRELPTLVLVIMCALGSLLVAINILHIHRRIGDIEQQAFLVLFVLRLMHTLISNLP